MINFNQPETYEHIDFQSMDFPFGCYHIPDFPTLPHWHNHMEIIYAKKGSVNVYINGNQYPLVEGDISFIPGSSLHSIIPLGHALYTAIVIGDELLSDTHYDTHFNQLLLPFYPDYQMTPHRFTSSDEFYNDLAQCLESIIQEDQKETQYYEQMIKIEVFRFFALLLRNIPDLYVKKNTIQLFQTQNLKKAIEYLTNHYSEKITIKTMSQFMNLSEQHFSRLFKAYTGKTFIDYLNIFRLEQAKKLLISSDMPITQIPELTGFCNPNYFSRIFKNYYGYTPSQIRKSQINLTLM